MLIHITAHYLNPANVTTPRDLQHEAKIFKFFQKYTNSSNEYQQLREEFLHFRNQLFPFTSDKSCWLDSDNSHMFWLQQIEYTKVIGRFAVRIFSTSVNSVSSERSFSVQNLNHTK